MPTEVVRVTCRHFASSGSAGGACVTFGLPLARGELWCKGILRLTFGVRERVSVPSPSQSHLDATDASSKRGPGYYLWRMVLTFRATVRV